MKTRWYEDKRLLKAAYEQYGTLSEAARQLGGDATTLARWWTRHGLERLPRGPHPEAENTDALKKLHQSIYGKSN